MNSQNFKVFVLMKILKTRHDFLENISRSWNQETENLNEFKSYKRQKFAWNWIISSIKQTGKLSWNFKFKTQNFVKFSTIPKHAKIDWRFNSSYLQANDNENFKQQTENYSTNCYDKLKRSLPKLRIIPEFPKLQFSQEKQLSSKKHLV